MRHLQSVFFIAALFFAVPIAVGSTAPADAQTVVAADVDPNVVHPGFAPSPDAGDQVAAERRLYSNDEIDGGAALPWGDVLAELLQTLLLGLAAFAAFLLRKLPKSVVDGLDAVSRMTLQKNATEFLELALGYGINTTANAVRGKTMSIRIGSEVLERAVEYALRHAPGLVRKMGGVLQLREKLIARLDLDPADHFTAARPAIVEPLTIERVEPAPAAS